MSALPDYFRYWEKADPPLLASKTIEPSSTFAVRKGLSLKYGGPPIDCRLISVPKWQLRQADICFYR